MLEINKKLSKQKQSNKNNLFRFKLMKDKRLKSHQVMSSRHQKAPNRLLNKNPKKFKSTNLTIRLFRHRIMWSNRCKLI